MYRKFQAFSFWQKQWGDLEALDKNTSNIRGYGVWMVKFGTVVENANDIALCIVIPKKEFTDLLLWHCSIYCYTHKGIYRPTLILLPFS